MTRTALAIALVTALSGCALTVQPDMTQFRGFTVAPGVQMPAPVVVQWHVASSYAEIQELCQRGQQGFKFGCAVLRQNVCLIVTHTDTAHEVLGHEARHCLEWHLPPAQKFHR